MSMRPIRTHQLIAIQRPALWLLSFVVILCTVVMLLWMSYEYGRRTAGYDSADATAYIDLLQAQLEKSQAEIIETNRRATMLERNNQIDGGASVELKETLAQAKNEVLELKKELSFYKSIIAPEQGGRSLNIQTVQLKPNEEAGYYFKIMVSQRGKNDQLVRGNLEVSIVGVSQGQPVTLPLAEVSKDTKNPLKFGFKYFQNFEGVMILPDEFQAESLNIKVVPSDGKIKTVDEQFAWSDLIAGET